MISTDVTLYERYENANQGRTPKVTPKVWHIDKKSRQDEWKFDAAIALTVLILLLIAATAVAW